MYIFLIRKLLFIKILTEIILLKSNILISVEKFNNGMQSITEYN